MIMYESNNDWKGVIDDELICDSKHYENVCFTFDLKSYKAYDDKGNKIEGKYIELIIKEYDNDIRRS